MWIFSNEFNDITGKERWIASHTSQPAGMPLHKHEGFLSISENELKFYSEDMVLLFSLHKGSIKGISIGYDDTFRRFRDSPRGFIPPMKVSTQDKDIYLFTRTLGGRKTIGDKLFRGENRSINIWFNGQSFS